MKAVRRMLIVTLSIGALVGCWLVPSAGAAPSNSAAAADAGCDSNGLPNSLALCDGNGRATIKLKGNAVLKVEDGWVGLSGKAKVIRKRTKGGKVRRIRRKPIVPRVDTSKRGKYTVYTGNEMYFYLPPGNWRILIKGAGVSVSAVGKGHVNLRAKPHRRRDPVPALPPGLVSVAGSEYVDWPAIWRFFKFGNTEPPPVVTRRDSLRSGEGNEGSVTDRVGEQ